MALMQMDLFYHLLCIDRGCCLRKVPPYFIPIEDSIWFDIFMIFFYLFGICHA